MDIMFAFTSFHLNPCWRWLRWCDGAGVTVGDKLPHYFEHFDEHIRKSFLLLLLIIPDESERNLK